MEDTESAEISLGGRKFKIEAFSFDQLRRMLPSFAKLGKPLSEGGIDAALELLTEALDGQITKEELGKLKVKVPEITAAMPVLAQISGLASMGEARAAAK